MSRTYSRRTVLTAGFGLLTALSGAMLIATSRNSVNRQLQTSTTGSTAGTNSASAASVPASAAPASGFAVETSQIPVGGGEVFVGQQVVVTQPTAGTFAVLHTACPHDNCDVGEVRDGQIICFCHGSLFTLTGGLKRGPARKGLAKRPFEIFGDTLIVTDAEFAALGWRHCRDCSGCGDKA